MDTADGEIVLGDLSKRIQRTDKQWTIVTIIHFQPSKVCLSIRYHMVIWLSQKFFRDLSLIFEQ